MFVLVVVVAALVVLGLIGWCADRYETRRRRAVLSVGVVDGSMPYFHPYRVGTGTWAVVGRGSRYRYWVTSDPAEAEGVAAWMSQDAFMIGVEITAIQDPDRPLRTPEVASSIAAALSWHRGHRLALEGS